jgi:HAD superfamily hydrolase (TIGR01509 family)
MQIKGIFFDLGGTLFSYNYGARGRGAAKSAGEGKSSAPRRMGGGLGFVLRELGIEADPADIGASWGEANRHVGQRYGRERFFLHRDLFRDTMSHFLADFGHTASDDLLDEFHLRQREAMLENLPIRDDCHEALGQLKQRGLYLSIVSNIDDDYLYPLVGKHGLGHLLNHCTSSEEARSCKPDTEIFHHALKKSGLRTEEVLFVGDSLHHDVAGADAIGMRSARIVEEGIETPLTHGLEVTAQPTYEITHLTELVDIVEQNNGA